MNYLDDLIVNLAHRIFRGVMAIGAGFAYAQFILLGLLLVGAGTVTVVLVLKAALHVLLGA